MLYKATLTTINVNSGSTVNVFKLRECKKYKRYLPNFTFNIKIH